MFRAVSLAFLLLLLPVAGCIGDDSDDEVTRPNEVPETTERPEPAQEGNLIGAVTDPAQVPVVGARVWLLEIEGVETATARDGSYILKDLAPGEHLVRATADGFLGETFLVRIKSGQTTLLDIALTPESVSEPYHETLELAGLISCSLVFASADTPFRPFCVDFDPNARTTFDIELSSEPKRVVVELLWEANAPSAEALAMNAQTIGLGPQDTELGDTEGESVLSMTIPAAILDRYFPEGGKFRLNVTSAPSIGDEEGVAVGAAIEQAFTVLVTTFYVEAGPEGFSAVSGG